MVSCVHKAQSLVMDPRSVVALFLFLMIYLIRQWTSTPEPLSHPNYGISRFSYEITKTWDGRDLENASIKVTLLPHNDAGVKVLVDAPFYDDPPNPGGKPGQPFDALWDYEVVEVFFLNDNRKYLEVELCPHGQHLVLLLNDVRKPRKDKLPLDFQAVIEGTRWRGEAVIPAIYFPPDVSKINAYAIHGSGDKRTYKSLFPVPKDKYTQPDFHRLEYFEEIDFPGLLPSNVGQRYSSSMWTDVTL